MDATKQLSVTELLATFSPRQQPKAPRAQPTSTPEYKIKMDTPRRLRAKDQVSYVISDDSSPSTPDGDSSFSTTASPNHKVQNTRRKATIEDESDESDETIEEPSSTPPPRQFSAGHSLRQHSQLNRSLKAQENADKPRRKRTNPSKGRVSKARSRRAVPNVTSDATGPARTARNEVRDAITAETAVKRNNFFIAKKDYFLPLLPESNVVSKMIAQRAEALENPVELPIVEYEELTEQPSGIQAIMKPYQLKGLSFLVFLQRNGLSGILGDEMGLGKTLQSISLIQFLKENRGPTAQGHLPRPSLVVCPLSVLSSWIAETRRWAPGLNVLRFHGPSHERSRLKKIALGEEDRFGNSRRTKASKANGASADDTVVLSDGTEDKIDLVVTTYETFTSEQAWFKRAFVWKYAILDEGHKIKNGLSLISTALQGLSAEYRLILTGTPLQNNMTELWALLHWLYPEVFTSTTSDMFKNSFDLKCGKVNTKFMDDARQLLELIMLRRMKNSPGVNLNLPPKEEVLLYMPLTPMQRFWYTRLLSRVDQGLLEDLFTDAKGKETSAIEHESALKAWENKDIEELERLDDAGNADEWEESKEILRQALEQEARDDSKKSAWRKLMNLLMQLRKCCNHPYILPSAAPDPYYLGEHIVNASGKYMVLDKIIKQLVVKERKKILIFSGFTRMLDICEDFLNIREGDGEEFGYLRLDGGTSRARRNLSIRMFNDLESHYRVMLISTKAGGLGINLTAASDVIMLDQDWNPQVTLQAEARAHRIGQTKPVTVYKLCTQGTVEEQMMGRIKKKLYLSAKVTESMRDIHGASASNKKGRASKSSIDDDEPQLGTSELMSLVRRGAQALSHPEIDVKEMADWDWNTMLEKCKDRPLDIHVSERTSATSAKEDEQKWLSRMEHVETQVFEGKKIMKQKGWKDSVPLYNEITRQDRRLGKNTTVMVDGFAISKQSMQCAGWEAVPTMAGKDPRLAEPKRGKKEKINHQELCQVCWDGGDLVLCSGCPRSYHVKCLDKDFQAKANSKMQFHCSQHQCVDCEQKTGDAGGMIYRCRWCERGYCEDCLDFEKTDLLGNTLQEFELLGFPAVDQAFYIKCPSCKETHASYPNEKHLCDMLAQGYEAEIKRLKRPDVVTDTVAATSTVSVDRSSDSLASYAGSLTDGTSLDSLEIATPRLGIDGFEVIGATSRPNYRKRKADANLEILPMGSGKRGTFLSWR